MSVFTRPCRREECVGKKSCKHKHWHYEFRVRGIRHRGAIKEARTKWDAEQAETKIRQRLFDGQYGIPEIAPLFSDFVKNSFLPWSKTNKKSYRCDVWRAEVLIQHFGRKRLDEVTVEDVEKYKTHRRDSITQYGRRRAPGSVNLELQLLSKIFSLAISYRKALSNPCAQVSQFPLDNKRVRFFSYEEEQVLLSKLTGSLAHLHHFVVVGIGTGMRFGELLRLERDQIDFGRGVVLATRTKTRRDREIPMSEAVRAALADLCTIQTGSTFVFFNPHTGRPMKAVKNGMKKAFELAGISGAAPTHTMRHTFGTRLGEAGYNAYEIMALMGHTDIKTSSRYVHATDARKRAAVESITARAENLPHKIPTNHDHEEKAVAVNG